MPIFLEQRINFVRVGCFIGCRSLFPYAKATLILILARVLSPLLVIGKLGDLKNFDGCFNLAENAEKSAFKASLMLMLLMQG